MSRNFRGEWESGENGVMTMNWESNEWVNDLLDELDRKDKEIEEKGLIIDSFESEHNWIVGALKDILDKNGMKVEHDWLENVPYMIGLIEGHIDNLKDELQSVLRDWRAEQEMDQIGGSAKKYYAEPSEEVWDRHGDDVETSYEKEIKRQKEEEGE